MFRWNHDKNGALSSEEDLVLFNELPEDVRSNIYNHYLYKGFIDQFHDFLLIFKNEYIEFRGRE